MERFRLSEHKSMKNHEAAAVNSAVLALINGIVSPVLFGEQLHFGHQ